MSGSLDTQAIESAEAHQARRRAAAGEAMARGQAAMAMGDLAEAARWLDRARRIAGGNDAVELLLATVRLRRGEADKAAAGFAALAERHDLREAWLGLTAAHQAAGRPAEAAAALAEALAGHVGAWPDNLRDQAAAVAAAAFYPGWCWLDNNGRVQLRGGGPTITLRLDGAPVDHVPIPPLPGPGLLEVASEAGAPLGSPLQLARIFRIEGFIEASDNAISGWAWHPNHPAAPPVLTLIAADGAHRPVLAGPPGSGESRAGQRHDRPLAQPRRIHIPAEDLPGPAPLRVVGHTGRDLPGSPVDPAQLARYAAGVTEVLAGRPVSAEVLRAAPVPASYVGQHSGRSSPAPKVSVVIPVYGGLAVTCACLASLIAHTPTTRLIVVDDATPDPRLAAVLDGLKAEGRISLIRHSTNRGFPAAANSGIRAAETDDVVLLNADTLLASGWLAELRAAAHSAADIATATPFSNNATLLSYPRQEGGNPVPDQRRVERLARAAARANAGRTVEIPTAVGFCMYIRRDCIADVGLLREDVFAQGYGEENDFCLRARNRGWRHVAACGAFVGHVGGVSFGSARAQLLARNLAILNQLHPGYDALIAQNHSGPGLGAARRRIDRAILAARRPPQRESVVVITHDLGGGVQRQVDVRCAALIARGLRPILIRPELARPLLQGTGRCIVAVDPDLPNLVYDVASELPALIRLLARERPILVELHHMLGHDHALMALPAALGVPYEVHLHDYAWFCPRISLIGPERRYCGEPDLAGCTACIEDAGRNIDEPIAVGELVSRSAAELAGARRVVAPSADVARRFARHFPGLAATVEPWDDARPGRARAIKRGIRTIGVLGAIGIEKGYDVLLACARDAAARALPLRFVVLGHTTDDARLLAAGPVFITGEYAPDELAGLLASESVDLAFLPSIWPETWCFTLSEAWRAGLHVVAFDIGAPAERIRAHGGGTLLPLACRAPQINAALLDRK
jgi:GT2 family glycosyltransferase